MFAKSEKIFEENLWEKKNTGRVFLFCGSSLSIG